MSTERVVDPSIRIIKSGTCPTLSGKSKLTYQVGCDTEFNLAIRVATNNGGGFFSDEWVPLVVVEKVVQGPAAKKGLTSNTLRPIFKGKSVNTAGFLLAVLTHEGVVQRQEGKSRLHEVADWETFRAGLDAAVADKAAKQGGRATPTPKKVTPKPAARRG